MSSELQIILTSGVLSAIIAALCSYFTTKLTIGRIQKSERYEKIATTLIEFLNEIDSVGPPNFDGAAISLATGRSDEGTAAFKDSIDKLGEVFGIYKRAKVYLTKKSRTSLDAKADKIFALRNDAAMAQIENEGVPKIEEVDAFLPEFLALNLSFSTKFRATLVAEIESYNDGL